MLKLLSQRTQRNDLDQIQFWPRWWNGLEEEVVNPTGKTGAFQKINEMMIKIK